MQPISNTRRRLLRSAAALSTTLLTPLFADERRTLRVGYQKGGGLLSLLKAQATLEKRLGARGWEVSWSEFPAGPQLLEAMNAGSLDFGYTGAPPPVFAQAAGNDLVYVGAEPIGPSTEAVVVKRASAVADVIALKGKSVAVQKGSSAHFMLVAALERAGLAFTDIEPIYLAPAYGRAAFEADRVDAWVIWDPYLASAQASIDLRVLADHTGLPETVGFYLAPRAFAERFSTEIWAVLQELAGVGASVTANPRQAAELIAPQVGLPLPVVETWQQRARYGEKPIDAAITASQQKIADMFLRHHLIPKRIDVASAVWRVAGRMPGNSR
jgi:sulfonate transport system substrate-binding protein